MGRVAFRTGRLRTHKDRERDRNDKYGKRRLAEQLRNYP